MRKLTALLAVGLICVLSSGAFAADATININDYPNVIDGTGVVTATDGMLLHFTVNLTTPLESLVGIELKGFMQEVGNEQWLPNYKVPASSTPFNQGGFRNKNVPVGTPDIVFESFEIHPDLVNLVNQWNVDNPPPGGVDPVELQLAPGGDNDNHQVWVLLPGGPLSNPEPAPTVSGNLATFTYRVVSADAVAGKTYAFILDESWSVSGANMWQTTSGFSLGNAWDFTNVLMTNALDMFPADPLVFNDGLVTFEIPEPATMLLLGGGLIGLVSRLRRRK